MSQQTKLYGVDALTCPVCRKPCTASFDALSVNGLDTLGDAPIWQDLWECENGHRFIVIPPGANDGS